MNDIALQRSLTADLIALEGLYGAKNYKPLDVVLTRDLNETNPSTANPGKRLVSDVVLQDVRVLGMDLNADPTSTAAAVAHTATLEVKVMDAEKLATAEQAGTLSLALRRTGSAELAPVRTVAVSDLGSSGPRGVSRAPGGARLIAVSHRRVVPTITPDMIIRTHSVTVVHGDSSSAVQVPAERFGAGA